MTKIFKPILEGIEKRLSEAAYNYAGQIVEKLKESTYARSRGHFNNEYGSVSMRDRFLLDVKCAHRDALLAEISVEIEQFAIKLIKRKAGEWEQAAKEGAA